MDSEEFRRRGKEMVDYICELMDGVRGRRVTAEVEPDFLRPLLPEEAPVAAEPWDDIMADVESKIMPGVHQWHHPQFCAYFTTLGDCYPALLADMLSQFVGPMAFSWAASPVCTELETVVLDWLGKAIGLPETFLSQSNGGGVFQGSASDCVLVCMLAARTHTLRTLHMQDTSLPETHHLPRLVVYSSREAHSCLEKAASLSLVKLRLLEPDSDSRLRAQTLSKAIEEDKKQGLVPFFVLATLGSTGCCAFDPLQELAAVARQHDCWFHVDAAYAGCAFICPEFRPLLSGIELADSFNTNPYKLLLVTVDCACMWVTDRTKLTTTFRVDPVYLQHDREDEVFDYRHWGVPLTRQFRGLKLWFTMRSFGISRLQAHVRNHVRLAKRFENNVRGDVRFQVCNDVRMGLVCFRVRGDGDQLTMQLLTSVNRSGQLHVIPARVLGLYVIRYFVASQHATDQDIDFAWSMISQHATQILPSISLNPVIEGRTGEGPLSCGAPRTLPPPTPPSLHFPYTK